MTSAKNAARWLCKLYRERKSIGISEMVLHKLLYFSQREALIADSNSPLFPDSFEAWKYGPVMCAIRSSFHDISNASESELDPLSDADAAAIRTAIGRYADMGAWSLVNLAHGESSWINARKDCGPNDRCNNEITVDAIRIDAERMRERRRMLGEWRHLRGNA